MSKRKAALLVVAVLIVSLLLAIFLPYITINPYDAHADSACPADTTNGAYFVRGTDDAGNAICGFAYYNACPTSEAVSADDPLCTKSQPAESNSNPVTTATPATAPVATTPTVSSCGGK